MRAVGTCLTSLFALTACLGGGGGGATSGGASAPVALNLQLTSNPADFESAEYRRSGALEAVNASTLYAAGGDGAAVTVGIIDTGIDTGHAELAGAIHPASADLKRGDLLADGSGHGTAVAGLIGARRNGSATHGVAYNAQLLAVRADTPGSCPGACLFGQGDLASATDYAVANGARVLNFSLGDASGLADSDIAGLRASWDSGEDLRLRAHLGRPALTAGEQLGALGPFDLSGGYGRTVSLADLAAPAGFEISGGLAAGWRLSLAMAGDPGGVLDDSFWIQQTANGSSSDCCDQATGRLATVGLEHGGADSRALRLGVGVLGEDGGPYGTSGSGAFALDEATTYFVDVAATMALGGGMQAFGRAELGRTATAGGGGLVDEMADLWSTSFAVGLSARDVARPADRLTFTVLQPLRVEQGQGVLDVPVARDLAGNIQRQDVEVELTPKGREIDLELGYGLPLGSAGFGIGRLQTALMLRLAPNHDATAAPELLFGIAYRLSF